MKVEPGCLSAVHQRGFVFRIFIVDDSAIARAGIKAALEERAEWVVVGEAFNGRHALETFLGHAPHLTLMDFWMPEMNGLQAARHLIQRHPDALILMITTDPSRQLEKEARKAGIKGLCGKSQLHCLFTAIETVMDGRTYFSEDAVA
jgi:DNA-binding NarL/FixJ family response regulator